MRSISKTTIDEGLAVEIVTDAFGPTVQLAEFAEATEGWFNAAYVLVTSDGRRSVLKVAPPPARCFATSTTSWRPRSLHCGASPNRRRCRCLGVW